ncbi:MAG: large conductance mechanosensitive channel protein MscL [Mycobacteriales bacterium]
MLKGFRDFIMRGNVIDLAIAVVIGSAFGAVVSAFAKDFIGGLIGVIGGTPDFGAAGIAANGSKIIIGSTINALIYFVIVAAVIYFALVVPMNRLAALKKRGELPAEATATTEDLLAEIRDLLRAQNGALPSSGGAHPTTEPGTLPPPGTPPTV